MDLLSIIFIAIGLAMDCLAIAVANGIAKKHFDKIFTLKISLLFGLFQGGMFWISCFVCSNFANFDSIAKLFDSYDHWVAFVLLGILGLKMIIEDLQSKKCENSEKIKPQNSKNELLTLISLAIVVSIDSFVTGIIFIKHPEFVLSAALIIGFVSLLFTVIGIFIGIKFGSRFKIKAELIGGIILILIGIKILVEHLFFS